MNREIMSFATCKFLFDLENFYVIDVFPLQGHKGKACCKALVSPQSTTK